MTDVIVDDPPVEADEDTDDVGDDEDAEDTEHAVSAWPRRLAYAVVVAVVLVLTALTGWLGFRAYEAHRALDQRELFLQVGRQGAIDLTTIDFNEADADVQRILDSSTGGFRDDFAKRSQPFLDAVKQARSKTVGTVTEAGLESATDTGAQVLVAVTVQTSNAGAAQQEPRSWRMRVTVEQTGDGPRISGVEFVA
ncbi:mammalian cell entry protein [Mycolicibacterium sp. 050158]|uniref:mammalian cell entry protein n=1 Tax=Mycolicibacterium sp. 050158 TaxID=3090602 RepID=UPI00299CD7F3|nr:mammalian cell entry protein [Mycolicibacterium sp. 050158]MDX1891298.1 mammalian cell entry protein [Mycolicibacterium sp. 050158]